MAFKRIIPKFSLGETVLTRKASDSLNLSDIKLAIIRHVTGDWGDVGEVDHLANENSLLNKGRLMSVHKTRDGIVFWIITEWDRSVTTILLPDDY
jgi:hypothetical protein